MSDDGTWTVGRLRENADLEVDRYPERTINVPAGHAAYIYPVTDSATDDGSQTIDHAVALHHVTDMLENGEDG